MKKIKAFVIATAITAVAVVPVLANVSGLVSTSVSTSTSTSTSVSEEQYKKGDVNNDGNVNLEDAQAVLKAALLIEKLPTPAAEKAADINGDGAVKLEDAQAVLKEALKITENFQERK